MGDSPTRRVSWTADEMEQSPPAWPIGRREEMEAYRIDRFGSVDGIVLRSSEDPRPGPKEVLMRVRASSLNYRDLIVLKGGGRGPTKLGDVLVPPVANGVVDDLAGGEDRLKR